MDEERSGMDQERSGGVSSTGVVLIVIASVGLAVLVCGGVIVVCLVAITALGTSANKTFGTVSGTVGTTPPVVRIDAEKAAKQFVSDLGAGLTQAAWDQTSDGFHIRNLKVAGPDQSKYFAEFLEEHPGLRDPASIEIKSQNMDAKEPTMQATIISKSGGKTVLSLKLRIGLSGTWKVDEVAVLKEEKKQVGEKKKEVPSKDAGKQ